MAVYLDTSALVKLVAHESETTVLREWLITRDEPCATSMLARTELVRSIRRAAPGLIDDAHRLLETLYVLALSPATLRLAGQLDPPELRSLDALHLASAQLLADELTAFVCYDRRLAEAATRSGLPVAAPGAAPGDTS